MRPFFFLICNCIIDFNCVEKRIRYCLWSSSADNSEVPNRRACSLRFFRFSFHPACNFLCNKQKIPPCSFINLLSKKAGRVEFFSNPARLFRSALLLGTSEYPNLFLLYIRRWNPQGRLHQASWGALWEGRWRWFHSLQALCWQVVRKVDPQIQKIIVSYQFKSINSNSSKPM